MLGGPYEPPFQCFEANRGLSDRVDEAPRSAVTASLGGLERTGDLSSP